MLTLRIDEGLWGSGTNSMKPSRVEAAKTWRFLKKKSASTCPQIGIFNAAVQKFNAFVFRALQTGSGPAVEIISQFHLQIAHLRGQGRNRAQRQSFVLLAYSPALVVHSNLLLVACSF